MLKSLLRLFNKAGRARVEMFLAAVHALLDQVVLAAFTVSMLVRLTRHAGACMHGRQASNIDALLAPACGATGTCWVAGAAAVRRVHNTGYWQKVDVPFLCTCTFSLECGSKAKLLHGRAVLLVVAVPASGLHPCLCQLYGRLAKHCQHLTLTASRTSAARHPQRVLKTYHAHPTGRRAAPPPTHLHQWRRAVATGALG